MERLKIGERVTTPDGEGVIREEENYKYAHRYGVVHFVPVSKFAGWPIVYYFESELKPKGE